MESFWKSDCYIHYIGSNIKDSSLIRFKGKIIPLIDAIIKCFILFFENKGTMPLQKSIIEKNYRSSRWYSNESSKLNSISNMWGMWFVSKVMQTGKVLLVSFIGNLLKFKMSSISATLKRWIFGMGRRA